jgi:hypothetical protein
MRNTQLVALTGFLATLVLTSTSVLAVEINVSIDKHVVKPGDSITVSGTITDDNGNPGVFNYRATAIVAKHNNGGDRVIICDSGKQTTASDGAVSFECKIPTISELASMGVENAAERAVIPIKGGISAIDPETNESKKKHDKALILNTEKFEQKFKNALDRLDSFIAHAQELIARCDNITARAEEAGAERVIERCANFQEKMQKQIDKALAAQERINNAIKNLDSLNITEFENLGRGLVNFKDGTRDFKVEVKDIREFIEKSKADLERKVAKEIADRAREKAKEIRKSALEERKILEEKVREIRKEIEEKEKRGLRPTSLTELNEVKPVPKPVSDITSISKSGKTGKNLENTRESLSSSSSLESDKSGSSDKNE